MLFNMAPSEVNKNIPTLHTNLLAGALRFGGGLRLRLDGGVMLRLRCRGGGLRRRGDGLRRRGDGLLRRGEGVLRRVDLLW